MLGRSLKIVFLVTLMALAASAQTIPAGTRLTVRVGSEISSGTAKAGDRFDATLARPLVVRGKTLARTGAPARGKVTSRFGPGESSLFGADMTRRSSRLVMAHATSLCP